ncbi:hypothetical protein [Pararhizobium sp. LjRoot238]|uniref:hypothetical protein n=1 Tax=Pararhizobium sp. LjRoot238 TaxID=3342293 RepID=UPI003ECE3B1B
MSIVHERLAPRQLNLYGFAGELCSATALYFLVKQPDGTYKLNGVQMLQQAPGPEI